MKLNKIVENDISRREFVKRGLGALSTLLISKGVDPNMAKMFKDAKPVFLRTSMGCAADHGLPADTAFSDVLKDFQALLKIGGGKAKAYVDPENEDFFGLVRSDSSVASELLNKAEHVEEWSDDTLYFELPGENKGWFLSTKQPEELVDMPITKNIAQTWWNDWAEYSVSPMSDKFVGVMRSNGIDVTIRHESTKECIAHEIVSDPELWGDPAKYGVTQSEIINAKQQIQDFRDKVRGPNTRAEGDPIEYTPEPTHDQHLAEPMHQPFESLQRRLDALFEGKKDKDDPEYKAAVAIVQYRDKWLLGLSLSNDDRRLRWCMPGGGVKGTESPEKAAERECKEETGVTCKAVGKAFTMSGKPNVAFVHCKAEYIKRMEPNSEFAALGFFTRQEMKSLTLYKNVYDLIDRCH